MRRSNAARDSGTLSSKLWTGSPGGNGPRKAIAKAIMLILSRKQGEAIVIGGNITVTIVKIEGSVVKLGIEAPAEIPVHRKEVAEKLAKTPKPK